MAESQKIGSQVVSDQKGNYQEVDGPIEEEFTTAGVLKFGRTETQRMTRVTL